MEIKNILSAGEVEFYVETLKTTEISNIGSKVWFDEHQRLERLRQQCIVEAANNVEERVKDVLITFGQLPVLVHEVICIQLWRQKVWKKILKIEDKKLLNSFVGYMILYHECAAINFLQILLHHKDSVQSLKEEALDLIDYCAFQLIYISSETFKYEELGEEVDEMTRLKAQQKEMGLNIGLASIAILASLGENLDELSISAVVRLYDTHDVPVLMANLIEVQPWKRRKDGSLEVYTEGQWTYWEAEELCKSEAQCWIALRGLLLHEASRQHYELTAFRREALLKLQRFLHEDVIDQMPPLTQLRQLLGQLSMWNQPRPNKSPLILETVAPIREALLSKSSQWKKLIKKHTALMFDEEHKEEVVEIAKSVTETYDADMLVSLNVRSDPPDSSRRRCQECGKVASKKCSQCHKTWYCTRKCQVTNWPHHKISCNNDSV